MKDAIMYREAAHTNTVRSTAASKSKMLAPIPICDTVKREPIHSKARLSSATPNRSRIIGMARLAIGAITSAKANAGTTMCRLK